MRNRGSSPGVQTISGVHLPSYSMGTGSCFPGGEADHSPPSSVEVKNGGAVNALSMLSHSAVLNCLSTGTTCCNFVAVVLVIVFTLYSLCVVCPLLFVSFCVLCFV
jgi:hypothetical protein